MWVLLITWKKNKRVLRSWNTITEIWGPVRGEAKPDRAEYPSAGAPLTAAVLLLSILLTLKKSDHFLLFSLTALNVELTAIFGAPAPKSPEKLGRSLSNPCAPFEAR